LPREQNLDVACRPLSPDVGQAAARLQPDHRAREAAGIASQTGSCSGVSASCPGPVCEVAKE